MGLWKAFNSNVAAIEIGIGLLFAILLTSISFFFHNNPIGPLWLIIAVSGLLGMAAARGNSFNIERADSSDEKMRRWLFGVYTGLWFGTWTSVLRLDDYGVMVVVNFIAAGGVYGGLVAAMNHSIRLANASEHGYDITQPGRGFQSINMSLLQAFVYLTMAFNISRLLSREQLVGSDHHSSTLLFCATLAIFLAWTPRAYRPLEMGRLGDVALTMRLVLSFAVIGGVAAPFFLG